MLYVLNERFQNIICIEVISDDKIIDWGSDAMVGVAKDEELILLIRGDIDIEHQQWFLISGLLISLVVL